MLGSLVLAVRKEKTRCWEAWHWQFEKKKINVGKLGIGSLKRKNLLLGNLVLQFGKKTRCWEAWYWQFRKKQLGSLILVVKCNIDQKKKKKLARCLIKRRLGSGTLVSKFSS
jgi:hypothetical protein